MSASLPVSDVRTAAFALAAAGAWPEVCARLAAEPAMLRGSAELANLHGEGLMRTGRTREACAWLSALAPACERRGDRPALRRALNLLGAAQFELGDLTQATETFERAADLGRADGDDLLVARARNNLGAIANIQGRRNRALALYQLAVPAYQRLGNTDGLALCFHNMAITFRDCGQLARAEECERRALEFAREAGSLRLVALARLGRAEIALRQGDAALAEAGGRRAAHDFEQVPDPICTGDALRLVGTACLALGKPAEARAALDKALALVRRHGAALNEAETLRALAEWAAAAGDAAAAREYGQAAIAIFARLDAVDELQALSGWLTQLPGD